MKTPTTMIHPIRLIRTYLAEIACILILSGCSTAPIQTSEPIEKPVFEADRTLDEKTLETEGNRNIDPWQGFNRTMYRFNYQFDKYVFLPTVTGYKAITPDFLQKGIHNFFMNIRDVNTLINSILQLNMEKTANTTTRLLINSSIGLLGFIEVATDVPRTDEDFGQTLGYWGAGPGPYLVLPILGPSNVRDGIGLGADYLASTIIRDQVISLTLTQAFAWGTLDAIDTRAHIAFRYYETGSPVEYELIRRLYTTKRQLDIER